MLVSILCPLSQPLQTDSHIPPSPRAYPHRHWLKFTNNALSLYSRGIPLLNPKSHTTFLTYFYAAGPRTRPRCEHLLQVQWEFTLTLHSPIPHDDPYPTTCRMAYPSCIWWLLVSGVNWVNVRVFRSQRPLPSQQKVEARGRSISQEERGGRACVPAYQ